MYQNRYSIVNRNVFARYDAPTYFLTYAETVFLEAEAAVRGRTTEDPAALYESGVTAAMQIAKIASLEGSFPAATVPGISDAAINTYPAANPYNPGDALNPLNTQYWLNTYMDE